MTSADSLLNQAIQCQRNQQWDEAILFYRQVLEKQPGFLPALVNLGTVYRRCQQFEQARDCLQQAIESPSAPLEAWVNFGILWTDLKNWRQAETCFQKVLQQDQKNIQALYRLASIAGSQGRWQDAIGLYQQVVTHAPRFASAFLDLGNAYRHVGDYQTALQCYERVVAIDPNSWKGHYSLARLYDPKTQQDKFTLHYQAALQQAPNTWVIHYNLAQTRFDHADYSHAAEQYELAIAAAPALLDAQIGLGAACMHLQQVERAKQCFENVSKSNDVVILSNLARIIWEYKFFPEAIAVLEKMVTLRPDLYDTHLNLAKAYSQNWNLSKASKCLQKTLAIKADCQEARDLLANIYVKQGRCDDSVALYEQQVERDDMLSPAVSSLLFTILYSSQVTALQKATKHFQLMQKWTDKLAANTIFKNSLAPRKRIKIGYISADFRDQHPVGLFLQPVLRAHNKANFEIYAYYNTRTYDDSTYAIKALVDHWYDVAEWTDERLKLQIMADQIDILVDLAGHTAKNRLRLFARRAAPVQLSWLGYPHSTGLPTMDYYIADPIVCPKEHDNLFAEKVMRLPDHCVFCYPPDDLYGPVDTATPQQRDAIVLGSFNNLTKVNQTTLALWADVLKAIPDVHLKLKTPSFTDMTCVRQVRDYFTHKGVHSNRLILTGPSSLADMMREYRQVDIALDPVPYNGGTTSMQALWMGVPVVTLCGNNLCGRMGASMLHHLGLADWVAKTQEEYIAIITKMTRDRPKLLSLKASLRRRMLASPLCDINGYTLELEQIYQQIWQHYCESNKH